MTPSELCHAICGSRWAHNGYKGRMFAGQLGPWDVWTPVPGRKGPPDFPGPGRWLLKSKFTVRHSKEDPRELPSDHPILVLG